MERLTFYAYGQRIGSYVGHPVEIKTMFFIAESMNWVTDVVFVEKYDEH